MIGYPATGVKGRVSLGDVVIDLPGKPVKGQVYLEARLVRLEQKFDLTKDEIHKS